MAFNYSNPNAKPNKNQQHGQQPKQQWQPPPPKQYGQPPHGQRGKPPPNKQHTYPPKQQHRQPPPSQQYGQPPHGKHGQPPSKQPRQTLPKQHGQPPVQQQQHWQPPAPQQKYVNRGHQPQVSGNSPPAHKQHGQPPPSKPYEKPAPQQQHWQPPAPKQHGQPQSQHQPPSKQYGAPSQPKQHGQAPQKQHSQPPPKQYEQPQPQQQSGKPLPSQPPKQNQQPQHWQPSPPKQQQQQYANRGHQPQVSAQGQSQHYAKRPHPAQISGHQTQVSAQLNRQISQRSLNSDDNKETEEKRRIIVKNMNIHFNFFDESQYGIANFPKTLSEIGVLSSKIKRKGMVVGCGSGRLVFEMAKHFVAMDGIDTNGDCIAAANTFKTAQMIEWELPNHGDIVDGYKSAAFKDLKCDKTILSKCNFVEIKDYHTIALSYNKYDCVIILNVLDKLHSPKKFVNSIQRRVNKGGILIFSECYDWNETVTNKIKWIGGTGNKTSSDALKEMLRMFTLIKEDKMSFIERKNAFSFKLSIANTVILKKN